MASPKSGGSVAGGLFALIAVAAIIGLRVYRVQQREARMEQREAEVQALAAESLKHAHQLADKAPEASAIPLIHTAIDKHHDEAWDEGDGSETLYRDALLRMVAEDGAKSGREDVSRSVAKLLQKSRLAGESWWVIK
jgi:hypothetical protein